MKCTEDNMQDIYFLFINNYIPRDTSEKFKFLCREKLQEPEDLILYPIQLLLQCYLKRKLTLNLRQQLQRGITDPSRISCRHDVIHSIRETWQPTLPPTFYTTQFWSSCSESLTIKSLPTFCRWRIAVKAVNDEPLNYQLRYTHC